MDKNNHAGSATDIDLAALEAILEAGSVCTSPVAMREFLQSAQVMIRNGKVSRSNIPSATGIDLDRLEAIAEHIKANDLWESGNELLEMIALARATPQHPDEPSEESVQRLTAYALAGIKEADAQPEQASESEAFKTAMVAAGYPENMFDCFLAEGVIAYYDPAANKMYDAWEAGRAALAIPASIAASDPMGDGWHSLTCDGTCKPLCAAASEQQAGADEHEDFDQWMHERLFSNPPLPVTAFDAWKAARAEPTHRATTATCQPAALTGQPDGAVCQPGASTAAPGYKLVPVELTDGMRTACRVLNDADDIDAEWSRLLAAAPDTATTAADPCDCCDAIREAEAIYGDGPDATTAADQQGDPDECAANMNGHRFGAHGINGERQCEWCGAAQQGAAQAQAGDARDAARYRFLRDNNHATAPFIAQYGPEMAGDENAVPNWLTSKADAAINAAMAAPGTSGGGNG